VTNIDTEVFDEIERRGYGVRHRSEVKSHYLPGVVGHLRALGVLHDKHVPEEYLTGSIQQRLDLLRGLMDTDGYAESPKRHRTPRVEFVSKDRALAEAVLELARSLGFKPSIKEGRVLWTAWDDDLAPFHLTRKRERLAKRPDRLTRSMRDAVVAVEPCGDIDGVCIAIDHPSHTYLAGRDYIPTHNTTLGSGLTAYLAFADGEPGAQVLCAASNERQARFAFDPLRKLSREAPALRQNVQVFMRKIVHQRTSSYIEVATAAAEALHGANLHGGLVDELHVHRNPDLVEVIETGTGSRRQPMILLITTADDSRQDTIYARRHDYTESLARRTITDPTFYGVVWAADRRADPFDEETWRAANPGYPVSPTRGYLSSAASEARQSPAELAKFLRLHLNIRTKQESRYFPMDLWDANDAPVDRAAMRGRDAFGGLDLASTQDLTALCWVLPDPKAHGYYDVLWRFWLPEATLDDLDRRTAGTASVWHKRGWLEVTPGNVADYEWLRTDILRDAVHFTVQSLAIDRWNATHLASRLDEDGVPVVLMGQTIASMSAPTKEMRRLLGLGLDGPRLRHGGNPVARWMADHFAVEMDSLGNVKPSKRRASEKIDGITALIMALDRATSEPLATPNVAFV
jgi:phage terminase large subunit-like protein